MHASRLAGSGMTLGSLPLILVEPSDHTRPLLACSACHESAASVTHLPNVNALIVRIIAEFPTAVGQQRR
jgi:hypothetical protein